MIDDGVLPVFSLSLSLLLPLALMPFSQCIFFVSSAQLSRAD